MTTAWPGVDNWRWRFPPSGGSQTLRCEGSPVHGHALALHQGLGCAPAEANKLRVTKHWVQVLEEPSFSFGV